MAKSLKDFCALMLKTYGRPETIAYDIGDLANHFVEYFELSSYPNLMELKLLLDLHHQMASIQPSSMGGLAGCHYLDNFKKLNIEYEATNWQGRIEFTVIHECYEAIQETFEDIVRGYKAYRDPAEPTCMRPFANRFAAAVLMQPEVFLPVLLESGLDIFSLRLRFHMRSYASVAIRVRELLKPPAVDDVVDFLIAIYDRNSEGEPREWDFDCCANDFCAGCVVKTSGIRLSRSRRRANFRAYLFPRRLFPVRGEKPALGFIVDEVIETRKPIYYEKVMFDLLGENDIALVARPVHWHGRLAKVILVVVRKKDSYLLHKQIEGLAKLDKRLSVYVS
jgi:hypothetical protein